MAEKDTRALTEVLQRLNEHGRRIRLLEERVDRIVSSLHTLEEESKNAQSELKVGLERRDLKIKEILEVLDTIKKELARIDAELSKLATKAELKEIKTFIDVLNPITSKFVTKDEVERMLEDFNNLKAKNK